MLATIVTPSLNALQVFALVAVILFLVGAVASVVPAGARFVLLILALALAALALAVMFGG